MTDDAIFEFLHTELVNYTLESKELENKEAKVKFQSLCVKLIKFVINNFELLDSKSQSSSFEEE